MKLSNIISKMLPSTVHHVWVRHFTTDAADKQDLGTEKRIEWIKIYCVMLLHHSDIMYILLHGTDTNIWYMEKYALQMLWIG